MELIIFLDVDGVLNTVNGLYMLEPKLLENFYYLHHNLQKYYQVKVILSSEWRKIKYNFALIKKELQKMGIKIYDITPITLHDKSTLPKFIQMRQSDISEWIIQYRKKKNGIKFKWLIIDDLRLELFYNNLIHTNPYIGLSLEQVVNVIRMLKSQ